MTPNIRGDLKHNIIVNVLDGGFFGMALGFASFSTVLPLFVNTMTDSALLIGLIPALHSAFWYLPQLFMARPVARQKRLKPMVILLTINERLPYLGMILIAWKMLALENSLALALTFSMITWQSLGAGFTANAWQSMIAKIIPSEQRGGFFGLQASVGSLFSSASAIIAGLILENIASPFDFMLCFLFTSIAMLISWIFLASTRESESSEVALPTSSENYWNSLGTILRQDANFRMFLVARSLMQLAVMGFAFYTVYVVNHQRVGEAEVGLMTGVMMGTQIIANPLMGRLGDRWGHRRMLEIGLIAAMFSALLAWWAPSSGWFYLVVILAGIALVANWTISITITLEFGTNANRSAYIGLANTLIAPATILAPFLGGWMADLSGYPATFLFSAIGGVATLLVLHLLVNDPKQPRSRA